MEKKLLIIVILCAIVGTPFAAGGEKMSTVEDVQKSIAKTVKKAAEKRVTVPQKALILLPGKTEPEKTARIQAVKAVPKPPETLRTLGNEETLKAISTMVKNFEMNEKKMTKEMVIKSIKDFVDREQRKVIMLKKHQQYFKAMLKNVITENEHKTGAENPTEEKKKKIVNNRAAIEVTEVSLETHEEDIETLIDGIRRAAGVNMVMDSKAIAAGIAAGTVRSTVTLKVEGMALRSALNWITRLSGLVWTLKDEAIFITTRQNAGNADRKMRVYDVRDQMVPIPDFPAPDNISFGLSDDPMNF